jgi:protein-disulfide isomerase
MASTYLSREEQPPAGQAPTRAGPSFYVNWRESLQHGRSIGDSLAPIIITEFGDFECPYCQRFAAKFRMQRARLGKDIALSYIHFPLTRIHRFALPAARAAECAGIQGRFAAYHDILYEKQDSLGLKSWSSYAREAQVPDTTEFATCVANVSPMSRVEAGVAWGQRLGVKATPTVMVNGLLFLNPPSDSMLAATIARLLEDARE